MASDPPSFTCPLPLSDYPNVLLAHGGGGRLMQDLVDKVFKTAFSNPLLDELHDGVVLPAHHGRMAMTTDSFVVRPLVFPGGDIGRLAVHGTVNDLAMCGAQPRYLSAAFILEEGLPMQLLWQITQSMAASAREAGVQVVTGDTKVVERGKGDGLYINTTGFGVVSHEQQISPRQVRPGDAVIVSGDIARHGMAIMAVREGLEFDSAIASDSASVWPPVASLLDGSVAVSCLRDATRGGLASVLNEIAGACGHDILIDEKSVPLHADVGAACELLGLDPFYVASEGVFVAFVPEADAARALQAIRKCPVSSAASIVGEVSAGRGRVSVTGKLGTQRVLQTLAGEPLPRIC